MPEQAPHTGVVGRPAPGDSALEPLVREYLRERRAARRWRRVRYGLLGVALVALWAYHHTAPLTTPHTALVELQGVIGDTSRHADHINQGLRRAFAARGVRGVVLRIDSPGGSPVQAAAINAEIHRLKRAYPEIPFYVTIADLGTSGGYYVAVAADEIYAQPASVVGAIGVRLDSFGFVQSMEKLGIERRLLTAGEHKGMLDPFLPQAPAEVRHVQNMLDDVHRQFIGAVKRGRGARLAADRDIFSGLFWSGEQAHRLGLIDHFGGVDHLAQQVIGAAQVVDYTVSAPWAERFARRFGAAVVHAMAGGMRLQ